MSSLPRVRVIAVGGTISSVSGTPSAGVAPKLSAGDLVGVVPGLVSMDAEAGWPSAFASVAG